MVRSKEGLFVPGSYKEDCFADCENGEHTSGVSDSESDHRSLRRMQLRCCITRVDLRGDRNAEQSQAFLQHLFLSTRAQTSP